MSERVSVVIPAHNESQVIRRCLSTLLAGVEQDELEVIVVCNGCTDGTEAVVEEFVPRVRLVTTAIASKSHALNLGDEAAQHFPRFYVDADVEIDVEAVRRVSRVLTETPAMAAAPRLEIDLSRSSWLVRAYYTVWRSLPYVRDHLVGSGVYALDAGGRGRFSRFPDTLSEDLYVRGLFAPGERISVSSCAFLIRAPIRLVDLVRIKARRRAGNIQLQGLAGPEWQGHAGRTGLRGLLGIRGRAVLLVPIYLLVEAAAAGRARVKVWRRQYTWDRDERSRTTLAGSDGP